MPWENPAISSTEGWLEVFADAICAAAFGSSTAVVLTLLSAVVVCCSPFLCAFLGYWTLAFRCDFLRGLTTPKWWYHMI